MKVSVITLCLNGKEHLADALQSVSDQDYVNLEHLVIDGGSTDGSMEIIRRFAENNPALCWWSEPDNGIGEAMNRGLGHATGGLVAFLHADDRYVDPGVLSEVVRNLQEHPEAIWLTAGIEEIAGNGRLLRTLPARRFSTRRLLRNNILFHPATFVRREALESLGGFDPRLRYAMDYDLWLRLAKIAPPLVLNRTLASFRVHPGSRSSAQRILALEEEYLVRTRYLSGRYEQILHGSYQFMRRTFEMWSHR